MNLPAQTDIGSKVTVRLHDPEGGYRDILGILETTTAVRKRSGELAHFDPAKIHIWKIIPTINHSAGTGAPLSLRIAELEEAAAATWPAAESVDFGGWRYRTSEGFTFRANSILPIGKAPLGEPLFGLEAATSHAIAYFKERGLLPAFHLPLPGFGALDQYLADCGWELTVEAHVMIADRAELKFSNEPLEFWIGTAPTPAWLSVQGEDRAGPIMSRYPAKYVGLRVADQDVAVGRLAEADGWAILTRIFVKPEFRGRGFGAAVIKELVSQSGCEKIALQVDISNLPAIDLYKKMGFRVHHNYRYRTWRR